MSQSVSLNKKEIEALVSFSFKGQGSYVLTGVKYQASTQEFIATDGKRLLAIPATVTDKAGLIKQVPNKPENDIIISADDLKDAVKLLKSNKFTVYESLFFGDKGLLFSTNIDKHTSQQCRPIEGDYPDYTRHMVDLPAVAGEVYLGGKLFLDTWKALSGLASHITIEVKHTGHSKPVYLRTVIEGKEIKAICLPLNKGKIDWGIK